jgi:hypothetical protein
MIAIINDSCDRAPDLDDAQESISFERFTYRRHREFPVRSQASRTRAQRRSRGGAAARQKSASFNGVNRRGLGKYWR